MSVRFFTFGGYKSLRSGVRFLTFGGYKCLRLGVSFLTFGGYKSLRLGVRYLTFGGLKSLRSGVRFLTFGVFILYVWWYIYKSLLRPNLRGLVFERGLLVRQIYYLCDARAFGPGLARNEPDGSPDRQEKQRRPLFTHLEPAFYFKKNLSKVDI